MPQKSVKQMDARDERQYMLHEDFEIYEKVGAPVGATSLHYHDFYELMYIAEGDFDIYVEPSVYHLKKGDFLLIDRSRLHHYLYQPGKHDSCRRILLWVTDSLLTNLAGGQDTPDLSVCFSSPDCTYHFPLHYEDMLNNFLLKVVLADSEDSSQPSFRSLMDRAYLTLFFAQLCHLCTDTRYHFSEQNHDNHPLVQSISTYIDLHLTEELTLDVLAAHVHMSKYHFLRSFKALTSLTVHQFLLHKRLIAACDKMRQGILPNEAALSSGFSDYSSFFRNFKKVYGLTPKEYCKR